MTEEEYVDFIQCRQTRFFSKGIKLVLDWLCVRREGTELKFRKVLEAFGYIMRYVVQRIVLQAVKVENGGRLIPTAKALQLASYQQATDSVIDEIAKKRLEWQDQLIAF